MQFSCIDGTILHTIYYLLAAVLLARKMADLTHAQCKNGAMSYTGVGLLLYPYSVGITFEKLIYFQKHIFCNFVLYIFVIVIYLRIPLYLHVWYYVFDFRIQYLQFILYF